MNKQKWDITNGDIINDMGGGMGMNSEGHMMMDMGGDMSMDLETGEMHTTSSFGCDDNDDD